MREVGAGAVVLTKGASPVVGFQRVCDGKSVSAKFLRGRPLPLGSLCTQSWECLLFVCCMGILVALAHQAAFQNLTAQGHGDGLCACPRMGFVGLCLHRAAENKPSADWPQ